MDSIEVKPKRADSDTSSEKLKHEASDKDGVEVSNVPYVLKGDPTDVEFAGNVPSPEDGVVVHNAADIVTQVLSLEDDPSLNPWTFRMWFLGLGLAIFGSVLQEIFYFKPQVIYVSLVFLTVIAYAFGEFMAAVIPRRGWMGRWLNPHPFNLKEHAAITLMASAGTQSALATEALAAQQLFYGGYPSKAAGIFLVLSSQLIGYTVAGLLRNVLVRPVKMLWPSNLPLTSLLETFHGSKAPDAKTIVKKRMKIFWIIAAIIFVWEVFPEYIFPVLEGVSIFCLARQDNMVFTNLFGGASGNEGLGFLSICFDWQYIASLGSPMWLPLETMVNSLVGYLGCIILFMGMYYGNIFRAQDFPFLSQELFDGTSNGTNAFIFNQTAIMTPEFIVDDQLLKAEGLPWLTTTYLAYLITTNLGLTACFTHMMLWNYDDLKAAWSWASPSSIKELISDPHWYKFWRTSTPEEDQAWAAKMMDDDRCDPHYKIMMKNEYKEAPMWWWGALLAISWAVGLVCLYVMKATLPWWGFILSTLFTFVFVLFFGAQQGITGFGFNIQPICQMLAGYLFPGRPLANLYFTCYTYNAAAMGGVLARDLKLAPMCTFAVQVVGCLVGGMMNWVMMVDIVQNQATILKSVQGTNIWSGQNIQQFNTLAIAWSIAKDMFSVGAKYQWVTLAYLLGFFVPIPQYLANKIYPHRVWSYFNISIIAWYMGWLFVGINASITSYFAVGFFAQFYLRKYRPRWFNKYNYIVSAALDGGTQTLVFILTFAVFGGSGKDRPFPNWAGNPDTSVHNLDYCAVSPIVVQ
ncbi:Oligopeptide transporter, OPT superfamily [Kalmanozyma brasiliensis GHG001]|uniref:Oligopeptide transporter n=1 Tax=Kalmanozyma brasiliensis (strain GHG001) TaxID=1365824 RepID=V5ENW9_KALBG|nr:Oligopeptide transporter, OPT superfamily [Kalmanozyma brasiliensis GHG001]EST04618.1 Oligopeptide transporter, OPT superfamily [Kalmanozyma brasiliensis GHG001]